MNKDYKLHPTPKNSDGNLLRRKVIPDNISIHTRMKKIQDLKDNRNLAEEAVTIDGVKLEVFTFSFMGQPAGSYILHFNTFTDRNREDYRPYLLEEIGTEGLYAGTFLLPSDGIHSYTIADVTGLPHDIGRTRQGWIKVHNRGRKDPKNSLSLYRTR